MSYCKSGSVKLIEFILKHLHGELQSETECFFMKRNSGPEILNIESL